MRHAPLLATLPLLMLAAGCTTVSLAPDVKPSAPPASKKMSHAAPVVQLGHGIETAHRPRDAAKPIQNWDIALTDKTLKSTISRWAQTAGWQLSWELPADYAIEVHATLVGTFEEAVEDVAKSLESAETPVKAIFYKGNQVLRIVAKGSK